MSVKKPAKTNAARALDALGIPYELRSYEVDLEDLSALNVAQKVGMPPEQVFKTLLCLTSNKEYVFAVVPGDAELDLKKLAAVAGARNAQLTSLKEVEPLTGYIRGGVTVLAAKKPFRAFVDETFELFDQVTVSGGQRGLQLLITPENYLEATQAELADLTKAPNREQEAG